MNLNIFADRLISTRKLTYRILSSKSAIVLESINNDQTDSQVKEPKSVFKGASHTGHRGHLQAVEQFFEANPTIAPYKAFIPSKILTTCHYKNPDRIYLVSPEIAKKIADHIVNRLEGTDQVIAESNPGLGLITRALLKNELPLVRMYESNSDFHSYLLEAFEKQNNRISLYKNDLFSLWKYLYIDQLDQGQRVPKLLEAIQKKSWTDDPVMTVVGTVTQQSFFKYLLRSVVLQKDIATYGRVDFFIITYPKLFSMFTSTNRMSSKLYKDWIIVLQLLFNIELVDIYPRKYFLPWETIRSSSKCSVNSEDADHLVLIKLTMKKEFPLPADHFVTFYCFMMFLYRSGNRAIIPTCERWLSGCGLNLLLPTQEHTSYFKDMDIYTLFKELTIPELLGVYREFSAHPHFQNSPFMDMVEREFLRSETIDTDLSDLNKNT